MIENIELPPDASSMCNSMRALGYSFETAVADIIDNSIAADASKIEIYTSISDDEPPFYAISDNGCGMSKETLIACMKLACHNPTDRREKLDLGRFGLGLKTASLSQCRELIVISWKDRCLSLASWNLDVVDKTRKWTLLLPKEQEVGFEDLINNLKLQDSGTLVIWKQFDRIGATGEQLPQTLRELASKSNEHISLVFHRFMSGEKGLTKITISVNGSVLSPKDPFLETGTASFPSTPLFLPDTHNVNESISVTVYTLPHQNKLTKRQQSNLGLPGRSLSDDQGIYIYRKGRLIYWGGWLGLRRAAQSAKLCRVRVDLPNTLDLHWQLDIKKSKAEPPKEIRTYLKNYFDRFIERSKNIQTRKSTKTQSDDALWTTEIDAEKYFIRINKASFIFKELIDSMDERTQNALEAYIHLLEAAVPITWLNAQYAADLKPKTSSEGKNQFRKQLTEMFISLNAISNNLSKEQYLSIFNNHPAFAEHPELISEVLNDLLKE